MKEKKIIISIPIVAVIIILIIVALLIINKTGLTEEEKRIKKGYTVLGYDYCEGHSDNIIAGDALTPWTCKICGYSGMNPDTEIPTICSECARLTGRCAKCGKIKGEKVLLKEAFTRKINKVDVSCDKMAYISGTDNIAFLGNNYDDDEKQNPNKIEIINMNDYSKVKKIKLDKDYTLDYDIKFDYVNDYINNIGNLNTLSDEEKLNLFEQGYEQEHELKYKYERQGRLFYDDGYIILINPQKDKSFIYNLETDKLVEEFEWDTGTYQGKQGIHIKNNYNNKDYYYFEEYDLLIESLKDIDFSKYYTDPYEIISSDLFDAQILYQNGLYILISYYEKEYGDIKLGIYNSNKELINVDQTNLEISNDSITILNNKYLILKYDLDKNEEIWSYDKNLKDKFYELKY